MFTPKPNPSAEPFLSASESQDARFRRGGSERRIGRHRTLTCSALVLAAVAAVAPPAHAQQVGSFVDVFSAGSAVSASGFGPDALGGGPVRFEPGLSDAYGPYFVPSTTAAGVPSPGAAAVLAVGLGFACRRRRG